MVVTPETFPEINSFSLPYNFLCHVAKSTKKTMSEQTKDPITANFVDPLWQFAKKSKMLINVCSKPDRKEFAKIAIATSVGFLIMGFIGFFVKLVHIPINQIIVGGGN